jgi:hypothetical protein
MNGDTPTPKAVMIRWCPVCGANDRYTTMGTKYHWALGKRCAGEPLKLRYEPQGQWKP